MDIDLYVYVFVAVGVVAFLFIFNRVRRLSESKRSEDLRSTALSLGMSFEDGHNIDANQRFGRFNLFSKGSGKRVSNCLSGTVDGVGVTTFGYEHTIDDAESSTTFRQTVIFFRSDELALPNFELRPRTFFDKVLFGKRKDIDFDSRYDFAKSYFLTGNDEKAIRQVFSTRVLHYFETHKRLCVEGRNKRLLCYRSVLDTAIGFRGARAKPDQLKLFIDEGREVFDLFRLKPSTAIGSDSDVKQAAMFDSSMRPWRPRVSGVVGFLFGPLVAAIVSFKNLRRLGSPQRADRVLIATVFACLLIGFLFLPFGFYVFQRVPSTDAIYENITMLLLLHIGNLLSPFVYPLLQRHEFEDWEAQEQQRRPTSGWSAALSTFVGFVLFYPLVFFGLLVAGELYGKL